MTTIRKSKPQTLYDCFSPTKRTAFLARFGCDPARLEPVGEDCAFRRYFRVYSKTDGTSAILMEAMPQDSPFRTPGHDLGDFVRLAGFLRARAISVPDLYEWDIADGYALLSDFGDVSFKTAAAQGETRRTDLYMLAADALADLHRKTAKDMPDSLPDYHQSHVHHGRVRVIDWYMPQILAKRPDDALRRDYLAVWDTIERSLPPAPAGFLHVDYHFENLMWRADQKGLNRCGILDFQGAMRGPLPYDLANLAEDARMDLPDALRRAILDRYCRDMGQAEKDHFMVWYRVLATQFHCRIAGQFIRLALRDGKPRYLAFMPYVLGHLRRGLQDPVLAPLQTWFAQNGIVFTDRAWSMEDLSMDHVPPDAF